MHSSIDEFERTLNLTAAIFACWSEEYEKLIAYLKEATKKKREAELKSGSGWLVAFHHKQLQDRLDFLKKYASFLLLLFKF
jgi:hypothetical protein